MVRDETIASGRLAIDVILVLIISVSTVFGLQAQDLLVALLLSVPRRMCTLAPCLFYTRKYTPPKKKASERVKQYNEARRPPVDSANRIPYCRGGWARAHRNGTEIHRS